MIPTNILKQKEISNKLIDKKQDKILKSNENIYFNDVTYNFKDKRIAKMYSNYFDIAITFFKKIREVK